MSFSDTSSERKINQEEYIKQKILSCKCSEYATIKWIIKNNFTDGIGNKICEYVACKSCSNIMSHFNSIEIDINPCDDDDIDEQSQIYIYNTLVNEFPDGKMTLILYKWKRNDTLSRLWTRIENMFYNSYSTVAFCMLEMNINDADCMDDNFNHETFIDCLRKILLYIKDNEQFIGNTIIDENKFDKVYERMQQGIYIWTP